jgi:hypothetical protein
MEKLNEQQKKPFNHAVRIGAVARADSGARIMGRKYHTATNRTQAMSIIDNVLARNNAARVNNVAGQFIVTELVMG